MLNRKIKRGLALFFIFVLTFSFFGERAFAEDYWKIKKVKNVSEIKPYTDMRNYDFSNLDLSKTGDLLYTLDIDTYNKWPRKDKLPKGFDPKKLIERGMEPGLNIRKLQKQGYTGKGVVVAYVDQVLLPNHEAYRNVKLHNTLIKDSEPSMHGPAVLSLLAGKKIGIVPEAEVHFYGHDGSEVDNLYEAKAFERIVKLNKTLPEHKKIKIIGMSHMADDSLNKDYAKRLRRAQKKARESGIIVVDVTCGMAIAGVRGFLDRDDYRNYEISHLYQGFLDTIIFKNDLIVPADCRTVAVGYRDNTKHYEYDGAMGGLSWGVPFITGVIAMGLQINPKLTEEEAFRYLHESAHDHLGGDFINPEGFLELVKKYKNHPKKIKKGKVEKKQEARYFLYNKEEVTEEDLRSILGYANGYEDGVISIWKDVSSYKDAADIYEMLKKEAKEKKIRIKGIQIFGTSAAVPGFSVKFKVQMQKGIDEGGFFKSDLFYSNFQSEEKVLRGEVSLYQAFKKKLKLGFVPEWEVARLNLLKGEIAAYMKRQRSYVESKKRKKFGNFVNFSNPIFASTEHSDNFGYFMKERLEKEFKILKPSSYALYGNQSGKYPIKSKLKGDFSRKNLEKENKGGIKEFLINSHGQDDNIDQCVFETYDKKSEKRISFVNTKNINSVLKHNYYDLNLWTCLNGYNLDENNIVHEAMAKGKCISAMAASSIISNNGVNNKATLTELRKNNFYYFFLQYFQNRKNGKGRSESFFRAKRDYAKEILKNTDKMGEGNYQFNLHNVLSYHYFGLLDNFEAAPAEVDETLLQSLIETGKQLSLEEEMEKAVEVPDFKYYNNFTDKPLSVESFKAYMVPSGFVFELHYKSKKDGDYNYFNPPNGDKLMENVEGGIKKGIHTAKFKISLKLIKSLEGFTIKSSADDYKGLLYFETEQLKSLLKVPKNKISKDSRVDKAVVPNW